jgi:hypothetical protein
VGEGGKVRKPQAMGRVPLDQPGLLKLNEGLSKRINIKRNAIRDGAGLHRIRDKTGIAAFIFVDLRQGKEEGGEAAGGPPIETDNLIAPELKLAPNRCIIAAERSRVIGQKVTQGIERQASDAGLPQGLRAMNVLREKAKAHGIADKSELDNFVSATGPHLIENDAPRLNEIEMGLALAGTE